MGQRSEVKSQSDRNLGIVVPKVLSHESPPPEPPELPHGDRTLAGRPARAPRHPGHTEGAELPPGGRRQLLYAPPARAIKGKAQNQPPPGPFRACPLRPWKTTCRRRPRLGKVRSGAPPPRQGQQGPLWGGDPSLPRPPPALLLRSRGRRRGGGRAARAWPGARRALRPRLRVWSNQPRNRKRTKGGPRLAGFARSPVLGSPLPRPPSGQRAPAAPTALVAPSAGRTARAGLSPCARAHGTVLTRLPERASQGVSRSRVPTARHRRTCGNVVDMRKVN